MLAFLSVSSWLESLLCGYGFELQKETQLNVSIYK